MWIGGQRIGSGIITLMDVEDVPIKQEDKRSSKERNDKAKVSKRKNPFFNPILNFFEVLQVSFQDQRLDKMLEL